VHLSASGYLHFVPIRFSRLSICFAYSNPQFASRIPRQGEDQLVHLVPQGLGIGVAEGNERMETLLLFALVVWMALVG